MSEYGLRYAELMGPPIVVSMGTIDGPLNEGSIPLVGMANCQMLVKEALAQVDWEGSGLPVKRFNPEGQFGEKDLVPRRYADRLMAFAFGEAHDIMQFCEEAAGAADIPIDGGFGKILMNSKHTLLLVPHLTDPDKSALINALKNPEFAAAYIETDIELPFIEVVRDRRGLIRFEWSAQIQKWIEPRLYPDRGCPALDIEVQLPDGQKIILMYYFWDKLTIAMYGAE